MAADPATYLPALTATPAGTQIRAHVQPRAARTEIVGLRADAIRIRLAAPPVDGAANDLLLRFLADALQVRRPAVELLTGRSSRSKTVLIHDMSPQTVAARLSDLEIPTRRWR